MNYILFAMILSLYLQCPGEPKCSKCDFQNEVCLKCDDSFFDKQVGKCQQNSSDGISHCLNYVKKNEEVSCSNCELGFGLVSNKCSKCKVSKCAKCDSNIDQCQACFNSIAGTVESCQSKGLYCKQDKCQICSVDKIDQCLECKVGYSIDQNGQCVKGVAHCKTIQEENKCEECLYGYYINSKYECISNIKKLFTQKTKIITFYVFIGLDILLLMYLLIKIRGERKSNDDLYQDINNQQTLDQLNF